MTWVKLLFDNRYDSFWKTIELSDMDHHYGDLLWNSYAPESLLNNLNSSQLADSLRTWYAYRERACQEIYGKSFSDFGYLQCLWYNRNIRSKTKNYIYYEDWFERGIVYIHDLLNPPLPGSKLFEELVLDFDISRYDRRKFNFLMNCIPNSWLRDSNSKSVDIFDSITSHLVDVQKVPRFAYSMLTETCVPESRIEFWEKLINVNADEDGPEETDWEEIHLRNFSGHFTLKFSIRLLHLTIFYLKLIAKILTVVIFVKTFLRQLFMFFANVIMLNLFGMILLKLLKISMTLIFLFQTLKRCLEFSRTISLHIYFFV